MPATPASTIATSSSSPSFTAVSTSSGATAPASARAGAGAAGGSGGAGPALPTPILPRDCYTSYQVRKIFGHKNAAGQIVPISRATLHRWREKGYLEHIRLNARHYLYTKASTHRFIERTNQTLIRPPAETPA